MASLGIRGLGARISFGLSRELWLIEAGVFLNMLGGVLPFEIIYLHNGRGAFLHLAVADVAMIAVGWGVFSWLLPPFARNQAGLSTSVIGLLLLANAMAVVVAQVPVARFAEGRRRALTMALAGGLFCGACLLVEVAAASRAVAVAVLVVAVIAAGVGECLHTTALTPLVAELACAAGTWR